MWPHDGNPAYGIFVKRQVESLRALGQTPEVMFVEGHRSRMSYLRAAWRMVRLNFSPHRPTLVHGHGGETALVVRWYVRAPVIVSYCGDDLLGTPGASGSLTRGSLLRRFVLRRLAPVMSATITKSAEMETALPAAARGRNLVLPNGVDRRLFACRPRDEARRELAWSPAERVVLFAADPSVPRKRYPLAEHACELAEREIGDIRLHVAWGTSPADMPRLMAASDCLLLTSQIEGSPNVVKEAVTCGLPVICTRAGDVAEVLDGVEPSWICSDSPTELARALAACLRDRRRSNGWERSAWLDEEQIARRLLELYDRLSGGRAHKASASCAA